MLRTFTGLLLFAVSASGAAQALPTVVEIRFVGNEVTEAVVMRQEMVISEGDPADPKRIERSRQAIMNLGLFQSVSTDLLQAEGGVVLVFTVVEKYYILPLPLVDAQPDGDYSYGAEIRFDNLFGLNQRLKVSYENVDSVNGDEELRRELGVDFDYPRVAGTNYSLGVRSQLNRNEFSSPEEIGNGRYLLEFREVSFGFSRWLQRAGPASGWRAGAGMGVEQRDFTHLSGEPGLYEDDQVVSVSGSVGFFEVQDLGTARRGYEYGINSALGVPEFGSDDDFTRNQFFHRRYRHYSSGANLNSQFRPGFANGTKFGGVAHSLGGDNTLRGYDSDVVEGNALLLLNLEYLQPLFRIRGLRGVVFTDIGNVYPGVLEIDLTDLRSAVGAGLRWQLESFVNVTLRVDAAYGAGGEVFVYANTSRPF